MSLGSGTHLGPYRIEGVIGAGGMGEVYRAHDPRLDRYVAIKVLPDAFSRDADRLRRFEQEARAAAALNHPNILAVHDIGLADGAPYVVCELLEGHTLREVLAAGRLPVRTALGLAAQIADAMAAAHAKGIVHRDLKPENVFVTADGRVKVLDFGLAKLGGTPADVDKTETRVSAETMPGTVLGTAGYMSPEQARGLPVDFRSDQFSLGTVVYEMLAGTHPFNRASVAQTMAAVIEQDPRPLAAVNPRVPAVAASVVERCLAKQPAARFASTTDLAHDLRTLNDQQSSARHADSATNPSLFALIAAGLIVVVGGALLWIYAPRRAATPDTAATVAPLLTSKLSQLTIAEGVERFPAWSPDGARLVYSGEAGGHRKLFLRTIASGEDRQITTGNADDLQPSWAPDGASIVFVRSHQPDGKLEPGDVFGTYDGGDVWSLDLQTGKQTRIVENAYGPAYSPDGRWLAVDASWAGPRRIWVVDKGGHNPRQVSSDESEAVFHLMPRWSPSGDALVFTNKEPTTFDIRVVTVATGATSWVTRDAVLDIYPIWSPAGDAIYFSSQRGGGINLWRMPVDAAGRPNGTARQLTTGAGQDLEVAASPDGRQLAFVTLKQNADLWQLPVSPSTGAVVGPPSQVVATSREDSRGEWSPDGRSIAFNSDRAENMNVWLHALDGSADRQLTRGAGGDYQPTWFPDGKSLAFFSSRGGTADIWAVDVQNSTITRLTEGSSLEINPSVSPDGRFIAYQSDQDGRMAPWIMKADGTAQRQLARITVLGHFLQWSADGTRVIARQTGAGPTGLATLVRLPVVDGPVEPYGEVAGGSHFSTSPDHTRVIDVVGHSALWLSRPGAAAPVKLFAFGEPDARIDYPQWSPDGRAVLFDRFQPQGGDVWLLGDFK